MDEWTHHERKITVTDAGLFQVEGLNHLPFSTLEQAKMGIDKNIKDTIGGLALPVIMGNGSGNTLTGIHGGHGGALLTGKSMGDALYPDHPAVRKLLQELKALRLTEERMLGQLAPLQLKRFGTKDAQAPDRNATAKADYDKKLAAAQALADRM